MIDDGVSVGFPRRKVLKLGAADVGNIFVWVVHDRASLKIALFPRFHEIRGAIAQWPV